VRYAREANVDLLIVISSSTAYAYSLIAVVCAAFDAPILERLFFDTAAILIALILLGRFLESSARRQTTRALSALLQLQVCSALLVLPDGVSTLELSAHLLQRGDTIVLCLQQPLVQSSLCCTPHFTAPAGENRKDFTEKRRRRTAAFEAHSADTDVCDCAGDCGCHAFCAVVSHAYFIQFE
jgi:hypothetical protein